MTLRQDHESLMNKADPLPIADPKPGRKKSPTETLRRSDTQKAWTPKEAFDRLNTFFEKEPLPEAEAWTEIAKHIGMLEQDRVRLLRIIALKDELKKLGG